MEDRLQLWAKSLIGLGVLLFLMLIARIMFFNYVDSYEMGYKFDKRTGELTTLDRTGWFATPPFVVSVNHVDLRPFQVCINANQRVLNCKLVQFDTAGLELFLSWHGRDNYDISSSAGSQSTTGFTEILKSYAYSGTGTKYPFIIVKDMVSAVRDTSQIK